MYRSIPFVAFLLLVALIGPRCFGQERNQISVYVQVSGDKEDEVRSYVTREIRSIPDASISYKKNHARWLLKILSKVDENKSGRRIGFTISSLVLSGDSDLNTRVLIRTLEMPESTREKLLQSFVRGYRDSYEIESHAIVQGGTGELQSICEQIVANLDGEFLQQSRRTFRKLERIREESSQTAPNDSLSKTIEPDSANTQ